ncbi:hypothetical protein CHS0354_031429 [Potamilus streckersoni]|uniref:Uncharacterized protein n=1 Tax=Potamilus streckersoni TaxID=2493646 RepID=A0AAE0SHR7_9BIVA|nr:hypothetical protein CHS0354_031429 [Potamilus streckersoni]
MIVHYNHNKPTNVYVVNSRLPVYKAYYGDGLGNIMAGLFTRIAPKVAPIAKQLAMKAIDVIRNKGINAVGDLAGTAFSTAKNRITSLVKSRFGRKPPPPLPSTTMMPANVSKVINNAVEQKLASLAMTSPDSSNIASMIAGSGLGGNRKRK